jgi:VWFA-related protein
MRRFASILLSTAIVLTASASSLPQSPAGSASPNKPKEPEPDIKVNSRLVVVDVVVSKGDHPVSGLQQSDFTLSEDGVQQTIRYFTPHFADQTDAARAPAAPLPALPPDTYTNLPAANVSDSVTVLLLDGLNTEPADVQYVRREMISYLKKLPSGRRIAVFALGYHLRMLQGFTTDTSQLMAALEKANATSPASLLPDEAFEKEEGVILDDSGVSAQDAANKSNFAAEAAASQMNMRVGMTLEAMQQLTRYLAGEPGRKNLVWFSGSFPAQVVSIARLVAGSQGQSMRTFDQQEKETADMLAVSRVAVYPVEVRGVLLMPLGADASFPPVLGPTGPNGSPSPPATQGEFLQRAAEHATMDVLAQQTGGRAVYDSNGLQEAMADAIDDGSNYYTLAYVPTNTNYNGAQRNIEIRLAHGKADLYYRHSYYADASMLAENGVKQDSKAIFLQSMARGLPASSQIVFDVRVAAPDQQPPNGSVAGANSAMKNRAARYAIDYAASLGTINLAENANGMRQGHIEAVAIAYDRDGNRLNWVASDVPIALDQAGWNQYSRSGLQIHQVLDLPAGDVYLRVGLYDPNSGRFGTFEIPLHVAASK